MANEKRLIDANALELPNYGNLEHPDPFTEGFRQGKFDAVLEIMTLAPTVDAVEVVHGHWVSLTECSNAGVYCSVCNKKVYKEDYAWCNRKNKLRSNYCPNCGAKMDGGNEDV